MNLIQTTKEAIQRKARQALGVEKSFFGFKAEPKFGMYDVVKQGDYNSMLEANLGRVWNCINLLSMDMAQIPIEIYVPGKDEDKQIYDHIFFDLLKTEPFHNTFQLKYMTEAHLNLTGNAYWLLSLNSFGRPVKVRFLFSNKTTPRFDKGKGERYYEYDVAGTLRKFSKEEIVHFRFPNPLSDLRGMGPVEAGRKKINLIEYMEEYQLALLGSRAIPPGYLKLEEEILPKEAKKLRASWKKQYGGIEKAGEIAVLGRGSEFVKLIMSPEDLQFLASVEFTEDQLGAMFGLSPYKLGRVKDVNRANAYELEKTYQKQTITPRLVMRDISLTEECLQKYDKKLFAKHPVVVPQDEEFELKKDQTLFSTAAITPNQIAKKWGYEPFPGGDVRLIAFNLVPLDTVSFAPPEPDKMIKSYPACSYRNKEWKEQYWKAYVGRTIKQERGMISVLRRFFESQKDEVISNLHKFGKSYKAAEVYLPSSDAADRKIIAILKPIILANVVKGGESLAIDFHLFAEGEFEANTIFIENFFKSREMLIKNINETTFEKLTTVINEAVNNGETIAEISQKVERVYTEAKGFRSRNIARTEVNTSVNFGHMEAMRQAAIDEKEWVTAGDERVRDTHIMNQNDGCIPMEHSFSGTGESYPGEYQCRCVVIPCMG